MWWARSENAGGSQLQVQELAQHDATQLKTNTACKPWASTHHHQQGLGQIKAVIPTLEMTTLRTQEAVTNDTLSSHQRYIYIYTI